MSFELRVSFTGLCLYLIHPNGRQAAVLQPDARKDNANPRHADDTDGEFHAAYLRFDLASLATGFPGAPGADEVPPYEVVHRFGRQVLDFGIPDDNNTALQVDLSVPDFGGFAPTLQLLPGLFSTTPPDELLTRMVLNGGTLSGLPEDSWKIPGFFHPDGTPTPGQFASLITWSRQVEGDGIELTLTDFDGGNEVRIPLRPVTTDTGDQVLSLKVANLCAKNALEWPELGIRTVDQDDVDFKWLYRLFEPAQGSYGDLLRGGTYPIPRLQHGNPFGVEDCMGGKVVTTFP
ncbi:MAG TPA: hypothetical protein VFQ39_18620 [Longimicrobium sp.]|nr:hypothetical protein [Longimicrobium sp.]